MLEFLLAVDNNLMVVGTPNHDKDPSYSGIVNVYDNLENESESILTLHNPSPDFFRSIWNFSCNRW